MFKDKDEMIERKSENSKNGLRIAVKGVARSKISCRYVKIANFCPILFGEKAMSLPGRLR